MKIVPCFLFIVLPVFASPVLAGQQSSQSPSSFPLQGRIGVGGALEYMSTEANLKIKPASGNLGDISSNQNQISKKLQFAPCLEFGLTMGNDYYWGLHISWRHSGAKNTSRSPIRGAYYFLHQFKVNSYIDLLAKAGYKLTPQIMVYGLIGPSFANWSYTTQQINQRDDTSPAKIIDQLKTRRNSMGLGLGAGFEYLIQSKYAVSFDYICHVHRSVTETNRISYDEPRVRGTSIVNVNHTGDLRRTIRPSYSTVSLRFTYFFSVF
ncbi:outer membrane protein [Candidatus Finniella inopinata]|uniref:Outer membrane protein beta-barrel domain-containing protein n=1 Tax=Candidatus Finniella inopinata TaxID=1696036 RepID=A0A4Q7DGB0_9PROT|nr:outer membrane beta-barrel protein [Candidatus Finniella inopinata]RZI45692.1 hypothetical protein EQU50_06210 [Candidatus Finniella inopinata]